MTGRIGILGGTFDPIHCGHLDAARAARSVLNLDAVLLVPSHIPPHRAVQPLASPFHRFAMTALAVNGLDGLIASDEELSAAGPSYTAETLERHRQSLDPSQIFFITGVDAFAEIETWRRYPAVIDMANFVVVSRPGYDARELRQRLPLLAPRMIDARAFEPAGRQPSILLLDAATEDVSSSEIRRRLANGLAVTGLVPSAVEAHIRKHRLYIPERSSREQFTQADELHGQS